MVAVIMAQVLRPPAIRLQLIVVLLETLLLLAIIQRLMFVLPMPTICHPNKAKVTIMADIINLSVLILSLPPALPLMYRFSIDVNKKRK